MKYHKRKGNKIRGKLPPHFISDKHKKVYFYFVSGFPAVLAVPYLMKTYMPDGYEGVIVSSPEYWKDEEEELKNG